MTQPAETKTIGDWLVDFYESLFKSGGQVNASAININQEAANAGYDPAQLAGVDASAAYAEACERPGVPPQYSSAPPPPPYSSPQDIVQHITQVTNVQQNFTNIDQSRDVNNVLNVDGDVSGGLDFAPVTNTGEGVAAGEGAKVAQVDIDASGGDATGTGGTATSTGGTATGGTATQTNDASGGDGTGGAGGAGGSGGDGGAGGAGPSVTLPPFGGGAPRELERVLTTDQPPSGGGGEGFGGGAGGAGGAGAAGGAGGAGTGGAGGTNEDNDNDASADASSFADASGNAQGGSGGPVSLNIDFGDDNDAPPPPSEEDATQV